jgi:hypothetical protein
MAFLGRQIFLKGIEFYADFKSSEKVVKMYTQKGYNIANFVHYFVVSVFFSKLFYRVSNCFEISLKFCVF